MAMQSHYHYPLSPALESASIIGRELRMGHISEAGPIKSTQKGSTSSKPAAEPSPASTPQIQQQSSASTPQTEQQSSASTPQTEQQSSASTPQTEQQSLASTPQTKQQSLTSTPQTEQNSEGHTIESNQEENSVPPELAAERSMDPYRDAKKIPYIKQAIYVYPYADDFISLEHRQRFPTIMDLFRLILYEAKKLSGLPPAKTEYKLKMCGTCIDDARPSILICHPQMDRKTGRAFMRILNESHVSQQYDSDETGPRFGVYLFLGPPPTYLGHRMENLNILMKDTSFAGAALVSSDTLSTCTVSTITCGIRFLGVDGPYFALTSAHAFEDDVEDSKMDTRFDTTGISQSPLDESGSQHDSEDEDTYTFADVEYDIAGLIECDTEDEWEQVRKSSIPRGGFSKIEHSHFDESDPSSHATYIKPAQVWSTDRPNLDWALIEIEESERWQEHDLISKIYEAPGLGDKNGRVLVITSRGSLEGTICNLPTFIADSNNNSHFCEVWSVILKNPESILVGDSGALVVDAHTNLPYGYVVSINHFQELHIMPLKYVLDQISEALALAFPNLQAQVFKSITPERGPVGPVADLTKSSLLTQHLIQRWPVHKDKDVSAAEQAVAKHGTNSNENLQHDAFKKIQDDISHDASTSQFASYSGEQPITYPSSADHRQIEPSTEAPLSDLWASSDGQLVPHPIVLESILRAEVRLERTAKAWGEIHQVNDLPDAFYVIGEVLPLLSIALRSITMGLEKASTTNWNDFPPQGRALAEFAEECRKRIKYFDDVLARVTEDAKLSKAKIYDIAAKEQGGVSLEEAMHYLLRMALRINIDGQRFFEDNLTKSLEDALEKLKRLRPSLNSMEDLDWMGASVRVVPGDMGTKAYNLGFWS